jgi:hypothetical protein
MTIPAIYTIKEKTRQTPEDAIAVSHAHLADRVPLAAASNVFYAEVAVPVMGRVTSVAVRLVRDGAPITLSGTLLVSMVSPATDLTGAFAFAFLENVPPASVGPAMYRKTDIHSAWYNTAKMGHSGRLYIMITGATGLEGASADVAIAVKPD